MNLEKLSDKDLEMLAAGNLEGMSDEGLVLISAQEKEPRQQEKDERSAVRKGVDYILRGLDYLGGLSRGALGGIAEAATGKELVNASDVFRGQAPTTAEMMERAGIPEGAKYSDIMPLLYSETGEGLALQKGGWADPTVRGTAGFAADVALDPLTYLSLGTSVAGKYGKLGEKLSKYLGKARDPLEKLATPLKSTAKTTGKGLYKKALTRIDEQALKYGKEPVSDLLMSQGVSGSARNIQKQMDELGGQLLQQRQAILKEAGKTGAEVSMREAMAPTLAKIQQIRASKNPALQPLADAMERDVQKYLALEARPATQALKELPVQGSFDITTLSEFIPKKPVIGIEDIASVPGPTPLQATQYKTSLYSQLPEAAFKDPSVYGAAKEYEKTMGTGLKRAIESSVEKTSGKMKAQELSELNKKLGQILTTKEKQALQAGIEGRRAVPGQVAPALLGAALGSSEGRGRLLGALLGKEAARALQFTGPATTIGKGLYQFGEEGSPIWDILLRQKLIEENRGE